MFKLHQFFNEEQDDFTNLKEDVLNKLVLGVIVFFSLTYFGYTAIDSTQNNAIQIQKLQEEVYQLREENKAITQYAENLQKKFSFTVEATAYTPRKEECNDDFMNTALMEKPKPGWHIAVSRDLSWMLGKKVYIKGHGVKMVSDLMNSRFTNKIDIMVGKVSEAREFGVKELEIVVLN